MTENGGFQGFSKDTVRFFRGLKANNNRAWFEGRRDLYENAVLAPARAFIETLGARMRGVVPKLIAVPKVNKSLFRLARDTRFSLDPSPYKANLGIYFWEGTRSRMECPGFYFQLEPPTVLLGGGYHFFADRALSRYRAAAADPKLGRELARIAAEIRRMDDWELGMRESLAADVRIPRAFLPAPPVVALPAHFQKSRMKRTRTVWISSRPASMQNERSHLPAGGMNW